MPRLLSLLARPRLTLLVSLPRNDVELAKAAVNGGAEALKVHINVHHAASGAHFGSFSEERENLRAILDAAGESPVGLVVGAEQMPTRAEMDALAEMGMDFFDAYSWHLPAWMLGYDRMTRMVAAGPQTLVDEAQVWEELGMECLELSIVSHDCYGQPLTVADLGKYRLYAEALEVPMVVPSQKKILPEEVEPLAATGVQSLMIGAIVTGKEPRTIEAATRAFRTAAERM